MKAQDVVKRLLGSRLLKWTVVVLAVGIGGYKIYEDWHGVSSGFAKIGLISSFEALLALLVAQFANLKVWQVLLTGLGSPLRTSVAGRILLIGQLGKYIPGSVWPILTQMELGAQAKVPRPRSASASALAMLLSVAVGLIIAIVTVPFGAVGSHSHDYVWVFLLLPVILACFYPKFLNPLLNRLFKLAKRPPLDTPISPRTIALAVAWQIVAWLFQGLQIWILAEKFGSPMGRTVLIALGGWAFAWCIGFLAIFVPAGAGIREFILVAALGPMIGNAPALAVALVSRAINTISDLLCAGVAAFRRPRLVAPETAEGLAAPATVPPDDPSLT
jgi:glycosyltransferase 2 family protein